MCGGGGGVCEAEGQLHVLMIACCSAKHMGKHETCMARSLTSDGSSGSDGTTSTITTTTTTTTMFMG